MTSQPQKMKLKPSITKEDIDNIIKKFAKSNGSPVQNKQEGLAYQIASELGLEKFAKSFTEENEISKSFNKAQDILEGPDPSTMVGKITADVERGIKGIRKSILQTNASALIAANITLPFIVSQISNPSLDVKTVKGIIKTNLKDSIQQAVQEDIITIEGKVTNIINKITDVVLRSREKAVDAYNKQFKIGAKVNIEEEILKGLDFDFDSPGVVAFFNLQDSMSDTFKNSDNINNSRRSYLDQALEEIKAGKDPLDVIKDYIKWDGGHLKSSSKKGDGQFTITENKNDLGQDTVARIKNAIDGKTNRSQVFENNVDYVNNLLNLISDKYEVKAVVQNPNAKKLKYNIKVIEKSTGLEINLDTKTPTLQSKLDGVNC